MRLGHGVTGRLDARVILASHLSNTFSTTYRLWVVLHNLTISTIVLSTLLPSLPTFPLPPPPLPFRPLYPHLYYTRHPNNKRNQLTRAPKRIYTPDIIVS